VLASSSRARREGGQAPRSRPCGRHLRWQA